MTKVGSFIHGVYPRSAELVQISRDFDRKRRSLSELKEQQKKDFESLLKLENSSNLDYLEDGKITWQDIFRPIIDATEGLEAGALTRWFDNNCFYRQPVITGKLQFDEKKMNLFFPKMTPSTKWKVTLPSPFAFAKLAENTKSADFEKSLDEISKLLSSILKYLEAKGVAFIQLDEPFIPYSNPKKTEIKLYLKSLSQLKKAKGKMILGVHGYFGDCTSLVSVLAESDALDIIGIDFYKTSLSSLPKKLSFDIIAGVIDGRNSLLEDKISLQKFTEKAIKHFDPVNLYLSNNSDLELLPESVAKEKVRLLGEIRKVFK